MASSVGEESLEGQHKQSREDDRDGKYHDLREEEKQYYEPTSVWYAATVFPLTAACFGPMASAFSICALIEDWRVIIPADGVATDEIMIEDPRWLVAINAVSLAIAIVANLSLLLSMAHRVPFTIAQPVTILGWYISSILLLVVVAVTPSRLDTASTYTLSQSFSYACIAAALYFFIASLLVATSYGAYRSYYPADFSLTLNLPQRTLMVQSLAFVVYMLSGAAVFSHIEGWLFVDGVYWATITLLTIGYGDVVPLTHLGRSLIIPYAIAGIIMLGLVVGSIGTLVLNRASGKMGARLTLKERERLKTAMDANDSNVESASHDENATPREKIQFNLMRRVQSRALSKQRLTLFAISCFALILLWFIGAVIFWQTESSPSSFQTVPWTYFDSVYFIFISLLTIGYGDFSIRSNAGRPLFVFWVMLAVPTMTILIASMGTEVLIIIKGIIAKIDAFVVLPHERGEKNSFTNKALHMGKLKMKAKARSGGAPVGSGEGGVEVHDGGTRNADTGQVMSLEKETEGIPPPEETINSGHRKRDMPNEIQRETRYLIASEIRNLLQYVSESPSKKYTFEEWTRFLHLLGISQTQDIVVDEAHPAAARSEEESENRNGIKDAGSGGIVERWSWLGDDSPLFTDQTETEWVLERLSKRLEDDLRVDRSPLTEK